MPSKADFQRLADWCVQPRSKPYLARVIFATLNEGNESGDGETGVATWSGYLQFTPARMSRWFPEHFAGTLFLQGSETTYITIAVAVGDKYATTGLTYFGYPGGFREFDVTEVDDDTTDNLCWVHLSGEQVSQGEIRKRTLILQTGQKFWWHTGPLP